jgi:hypothetical protein
MLQLSPIMFDELKELLEHSDGFCITVTTRNRTKLNHYFFTETFLMEIAKFFGVRMGSDGFIPLGYSGRFLVS